MVLRWGKELCKLVGLGVINIERENDTEEPRAMEVL
jgi:hypothetical protein